jgi:hypothetical protein
MILMGNSVNIIVVVCRVMFPLALHYDDVQLLHIAAHAERLEQEGYLTNLERMYSKVIASS